MLKEQVAQLSDEQKALISVSYLMEHPELWPEESKKIFSKLANYDQNAHNIQEAINQARKAITELKPQLDQIIGAMTALSGVAADFIPSDKYEEYCLAYNLPPELNKKFQSIKRAEDSVDMAGATSRDLPNIPKE
jgi:predicted  nucleic acid-binding Zn-ribbon protein